MIRILLLLLAALLAVWGIVDIAHGAVLIGAVLLLMGVILGAWAL